MNKCVMSIILIAMFIMMTAVGCENNTAVDNIPRDYIANGEYAVIHGEQIFYSNSSGFYSMNTDGSDQQKLNDTFARYANIVDNKIYFENSNEYGYIYSMNTDGTDLKQLNDESVWNVRVIGDWIYFNISSNSGNNYGDDGMGIYKMRTDGSESQLLTDDEVSNFDIAGDKIYYSTWDGVFSISIDGKNRLQLSDTFAWCINVVGEQILYINSDDERIYSIGLNGDSQRRLSKDKTRSIHVVGDRIYYTSNNDNRIYSIKPNGSDRRQLGDSDEVEWIIVFSSTILGIDSGIENDIFIFVPV